MSGQQTGRLEAGQAFGKYKIVRMLGEGGMGAVYEAMHTGLRKRFAIKTLLPLMAQSPEAEARFRREAQAASRITHPNVVAVTDVGTEQGISYLVMEYLEGETLGDLIDRTGPLELSRTIDIMLPSLAAVAAGHEQGVIHRDLKPQNVFIARGLWPEGVPKILDFGVSKILGEGNAALTGTMAVLGTAAYMSPEQARGSKLIDAASDQYALGLILHEMLTATRAHDGESPLEILHRIASGVIPDTAARRPDLPPEVLAIVRRMLAVDPRERFPSLRDVARALLPYAGERARMSYTGTFDGAADTQAITPLPEIRSPASSGPGSGARSGGTRLLPSTGGTRRIPPSTTLGQSALGLTPAATRPSRLPIALVGVGIVAVGGVALFFFRRSADTHVETPPTAAVAPPPAAELPPPVAAPPVAEIPRAAPPPPAVRAPAPSNPAATGESVDKHRKTRSSERREKAPARSSHASRPSHPPAPSDNSSPILE